MKRVVLATCATYDRTEISSAFDAALAPLGGMAAFVSPGQRVLLKVNLLSRAVPERAVTTHPEVVRAAIKAVRAAGGEVSVGDSPGGPNNPGGVRKIWEDSGIGAVCAEEGVPLLLFDDECVRVTAEGGTLYGAFTLGKAVADTDVLISLPKFKTHSLMMFTGAVKLLFGCIPGLEKAQFHVKVPDRDDFGGMLVDLMLACKPKLAVMDAVVGMEGDGPAGGTPRQIGTLIASADSVALDVVASSMAGLDPMEVYSNKAAAKRGLGPSSADEVEVLGADWRSLSPARFKLPQRDVSAKMPTWLARRIRGWTTSRPVLERASECTQCKTCEKNCPVGAIVVGEKGPVFDHSVCIRCYCCQELCPPQCIGLSVPPVARFATRGRGW